MNVQLPGSIPAQSVQTGLPAGRQPLQLIEGALLKATVQRVTDTMALLNVNGRLISARTEIPLQPRQEVLLEVTQTAPLQITLRSLPQPQTEPGQTALSLQNLQTILTGWGLEADETNLSIARALFTQSHTLTPDDIQTVRSLWQNLAPADAAGKEAALQAVTYLHTRQLPVNAESVALAHHWLTTPLSNGDQIAAGLDNLRQTLSATLTQLQPAAANNPALSQLTATLETALAQMSTWTIAADTPAAEIMARLSSLIPNLGTPPEAELYTLSQSQPQPANGSSAEATAASTLSPAPAAPGSEAAAQPGLPADPADLPALLRNLGRALSQNSAAGPDNPLHRLASAITDTLANAKLDESTPQGAQAAQALRALAGQLENVAKDLGAVQLANLTNVPQPSAEPYYLFPIPLQTPAGPRTAQLKVYRQPDRREIDPANVRLALLLDLPELGEIAVNLTVLEKRLSGQILSGRTQTHQRVEQDLKELRQNLAGLGYWVDALTCDLLSAPKPAPAVSTAAPAAGPNLPLTRLNVSV